MTITTIGLGLDYNEDLMTALASKSGGNAYFARNADTLPEIFTRDMEDAVTLTARKVRITLTCGDGIRPIRVVGRSALERSANTIGASIDNLYGAEKYALFEIEISETIDPEAEGFDAATAKLEYVDPATDSVVSREMRLRLALAKDDEEVAKNRRSDIVSQTELARNAEIREEVVRLADEGRVSEATQVLEERSRSLRQFAPSAGSAAPQMEAEADKFESITEDLREYGMSSPQRKSILNDAYIQKNQQTTIPED
jgi:Ca-activated chloride channel family protein